MINITVELVKKLVQEQFPKFSNLHIRPVKHSGHDNRTFHLGDDMSIRLPSDENYAPQIEKENTWLPYLQRHVSYPISSPIAIGKASAEYPFPWSINKWIEGEALFNKHIHNIDCLARDLAFFLRELQSINASKGPKAGKHNFYRGGDLRVYHDETLTALSRLKHDLHVPLLKSIWKDAISSSWQKADVWVHGDIAPGNLLIKDDRLYGIIDFGILGIGDPSCDYAMAWSYFDSNSRAIFYKTSKMDKDTWKRARGWALWKALITYDDPKSKRTIQEIINEFPQ